MSNESLRDRVERQLCMFFDEGYDGHLFDAAQAIIDDLGLTVEEGHITGQGYGLPGVIGKRIVGKWEKG